ncbi:hypothetical protein G9A89_002241, partial [Geosiphon pyriformis]
APIRNIFKRRVHVELKCELHISSDGHVLKYYAFVETHESYHTHVYHWFRDQYNDMLGKVGKVARIIQLIFGTIYWRKY